MIHTAHIGEEAQAAAAGLCEPGTDEVEVRDDVAAEVMGWFATLPGWTGGPAYAPHPVLAQEV